MTPIRAVKGMNDVLPAEIGRWHRVEAEFARTMQLHGFREVRTPYVESTRLFVGAIGEGTDVVEKEMYSFVHHDEPLTLRPEGTASAARAYVEHGVHKNEPVSRWYYVGPMFRGERPARGRYRQFHQVGAELFGDAGPASDAEMIDMIVSFLAAIGVRDSEVFINSLGGAGTRDRYRAALVSHLEPKKDKLSAESLRRLAINPLRILDSKAPADIEAVADAPTILDFLDNDDQAHFDETRRYLDALGTPYKVEPRLVRGLDYYTRTLFEIKAAKAILGAGDTVVGGGRYDNMIEGLGGPKVPAIGFAAGLERLLLASEATPETPVCDVFIAPHDKTGAPAMAAALVLARELRQQRVACEVETRPSSMKSQLRRANALNARLALIIGDAELSENTVTIKDLAGHTQDTVPRDRVVPIVVDRIVASESRAIAVDRGSPAKGNT